MKPSQSSRRTRADDVRAIRRLAAAWRSGWLAGDAEGLVSLYAEAPVLMPQGRRAVFGKRAIRALYRAVLDEVVIRSRSRVIEVAASGDLGYFWSTYAITATPKRGGPPIHSRGKSLFVVKREPRRGWRIARLMDNSDADA